MKTSIVLSFVLFISLTLESAAQDEASICRYLFASSYDVTKLSTDLISLSVDAVWEASGITGTATTTGTLMQNPNNPDVWTYSATPNDRLLVVFAGGPTITFIFYHIEGYTEGTAEDFKYSHLMDFNTSVNQINLRIYSNTAPQNDTIYWQRTITGNMPFDNQMMTVNINHSGKLDYYVEWPFAYYHYREYATGTSSTGTFSVNINESYARTFMHQNDISKFVLNTQMWNNSSGNFSGTTYKYENANVFWAAWTQLADSASAGNYNEVVDANQWSVQGTMIKNGQQYGVLQFSGPVYENTPGPDLILHLNNGTNYFIHPLIGFYITGIEDEFSKPAAFELMQNYPNPFNSSTVISWYMKNKELVSLKIYDILGNEVISVPDQLRSEGYNEIKLDSRNLASGVYFYKLFTENFSAVKKMIVIK